MDGALDIDRLLADIFGNIIRRFIDKHGREPSEDEISQHVESDYPYVAKVLGEVFFFEHVKDASRQYAMERDLDFDENERQNFSVVIGSSN